MGGLIKCLFEEKIELVYGKALTKKNRVKGDVPVYGSNGVVDSHNEAFFHGPGVIVGRKGTVGAIEYSKKDFWAIDTTYIVNMREENDCLEYWYYYLQTLNLSKMNTHSAVPGLNRDSVYKLPVEIFENVADRRNVAKFLGDLDKKIELNNVINETLENMAQSIFKQWFVDFEFPSEDGEPYKSSGGQMVESELGMIPDGWSVVKLQELATFKNGKKILEDKRDENGCNIIYGSNGEIGRTNEVLVTEEHIVIGRVGAYCGSLQRVLNPSWVTDNAIVSKPKRMEDYTYLYNVLRNSELRKRAGGSAQPLINQSILNNISVIKPNEKIIDHFYSITYSFLKKISQKRIENKHLERIRDTLLPKLMSGEIRVPLEDN